MDEKIIYTNQQMAIIGGFSSCNIICNSVAGSGKTTTILGICKEYKDKQFLILTYNRKLMDETKARADREFIFNVEIFISCLLWKFL